MVSNVLITGGNGVLGSSLTKLFLQDGKKVTATDIVRKDECWRLQNLDTLDKVNYLWKASQDISREDLKNIDLVVDCAIGFPDRPFGTLSPTLTVAANIGPALGLLEAVRKLDRKPLVIYPSSFNALYGNSGIYTEATNASPTTIYGWTKASVEQLYRTYHVSFGIPVLITRVGSSYGEMMRTDELVAKLILSGLRQEEFSLKSPDSKRLWTYLGDVITAYHSIAERTEYGQNLDFLNLLDPEDLVLNIAGNRNDEILTNMGLARLISDLVGVDMRIEEMGTYEPGELVHGAPIHFGVDAKLTRNLLKWEPVFSLKDGLNRTIEWFDKNLKAVRNWSYGKE